MCLDSDTSLVSVLVGLSVHVLKDPHCLLHKTRAVAAIRYQEGRVALLCARGVRVKPEVGIDWSLKVSIFQVGTGLTKEGRQRHKGCQHKKTQAMCHED